MENFFSNCNLPSYQLKLVFWEKKNKITINMVVEAAKQVSPLNGIELIDKVKDLFGINWWWSSSQPSPLSKLGGYSISTDKLEFGDHVFRIDNFSSERPGGRRIDYAILNPGWNDTFLPKEFRPHSTYRLSCMEAGVEMVAQATIYEVNGKVAVYSYLYNGTEEIPALEEHTPHPWSLEEQERVARIVGLIE